MYAAQGEKGHVGELELELMLQGVVELMGRGLTFEEERQFSAGFPLQTSSTSTHSFVFLFYLYNPFSAGVNRLPRGRPPT